MLNSFIVWMCHPVSKPLKLFISIVFKYLMNVSPCSIIVLLSYYWRLSLLHYCISLWRSLLWIHLLDKKCKSLSPCDYFTYFCQVHECNTLWWLLLLISLPTINDSLCNKNLCQISLIASMHHPGNTPVSLIIIDFCVHLWTKRVKRMNASPCDEYFYWFLCIPSSPWVIYKRFLWLSLWLSDILQQTLPNLSKYSVTF